ncbi:hypothetical protein D3C86_1360640 [compost metagenome]
MPATARGLLMTMQCQVARRRCIDRRFGVWADAVHALGIRQVFVPRLAGDGESGLAIELRNDRAELMQRAEHIVGEFARCQHRPAARRQLPMAVAQ